MLIGYARVSTEDQNLDLQCDALTAAGCERIFEDKASGVRDDRPGLAGALSHLRRGDCLVIWRLDRLGRRMIALLSFVEELRQRGCSAVKAIYGPRVTAFSRRTTVSSFAACQNRGASLQMPFAFPSTSRKSPQSPSRKFQVPNQCGLRGLEPPIRLRRRVMASIRPRASY